MDILLKIFLYLVIMILVGMAAFFIYQIFLYFHGLWSAERKTIYIIKRNRQILIKNGRLPCPCCGAEKDIIKIKWPPLCVYLCKKCGTAEDVDIWNDVYRRVKIV